MRTVLAFFVLATLEACSCNACTTCGDSCVNLQTNPDHCGRCGTVCEDDCRDGMCVCRRGFLDCGSVCVDPLLDPDNCGGCGITCAAGDRCVLGVCGGRTPMGDAGPCELPRIACDEECVDPTEDLRHCGECGTRCAQNEVCADGACECLRCEGDACTDIESDLGNCGACGVVCSEGESCLGGRCLGDRRLEFVLSWDTPGDVDLHVVRPDGVEISYRAPRPAPGPEGLDGDLDADDTRGTGPERVGFDAPTPGEYHVCVNPFRIATRTEWTLLRRENGVTLDALEGSLASTVGGLACTADEAELSFTFVE